MWKPINSMTHPIQPTTARLTVACSLSVCLSVWLALASMELAHIEKLVLAWNRRMNKAISLCERWTEQRFSKSATSSAKCDLRLLDDIETILGTTLLRQIPNNAHKSRASKLHFVVVVVVDFVFCTFITHAKFLSFCTFSRVFFTFLLWFYFASMLFSLNAIRAVRLLREGCFFVAAACMLLQLGVEVVWWMHGTVCWYAGYVQWFAKYATTKCQAKLSTYTCRIDFRLLPPSPRQMGQLCVNLSLTESVDWFVNGKSKQAIRGFPQMAIQFVYLLNPDYGWRSFTKSIKFKSIL